MDAARREPVSPIHGHNGLSCLLNHSGQLIREQGGVGFRRGTHTITPIIRFRIGILTGISPHPTCFQHAIVDLRVPSVKWAASHLEKWLGYSG
jgi:hypothetical protein